jgi:hypothetical protein
MAYLVLAISLLYALIWGAGLMLSLRSDGKKTVWIPVSGLLLFVGFSASSAMAVQTAMANPPKLTVENFLAATTGMSVDDLSGVFGAPKADEVQYDFKGEYSLVFPEEVNNRLRGERHAEQVDAKLGIKISGEPGRAHPRRGEGLGAMADEENNGLLGVEIAVMENGNMLRLVEGAEGSASELEEEPEGTVEVKYWQYETDMTPEEVAKRLGELIDETDAWHAEGSPDSDPRSVFITPENEANGGTICNTVCSAKVQNVTTAVGIRGFTDGTEQQFKGGEDETWVKVWQEDGVLMDADFSTNNRMIVAGFINDEMVGIVQSGLTLPPEAPAEAPAE